MRPALAICYDYSTPFEKCVAFADYAGFEVVSLGMNTSYSGYPTSEGRANIRRILQERGMSLNNIHDGNGALASTDEECRTKAATDALVAMEAAAELGAGMTVHHLGGTSREPANIPKEIEQVRRSVEALLPRAQKLGITLAFENGTNENYMACFREVMSQYDDPLIGFCYDTSHDRLWCGGTLETLEQFGSRLATLHVSDNRGERDDHQLPWEGIIDWSQFVRVLAQTGYEGDMLIEPVVERSQFKDLGEFTREAQARAERLIRMLDEERRS